MPIPDMEGEPGYLPAGDHPATMNEIEERFATNFRRRELFKGLERVVKELVNRGVTRICVDGSFTTDKARPNDVDVWFERPTGEDTTTWGLIATTAQNRDERRTRDRVDLCWDPMIGSAADLTHLPDFWRTKHGRDKGLVWVQLVEEEDDQEPEAARNSE